MKQEQLHSSLKLTTPGELTLFFIGTGSAFCRHFYQTNVLIIKGNDHILIDCGTRCSYALAGYGSSIQSIRTYLITHSHADHIGGLEEAALLGMYESCKRPAMIITDEYRDVLWNESLRGGLAHNENESAGLLSFSDYFEQISPRLIAAEPRPLYMLQFGSINLKLFRTIHIPDRNGSWKDGFISYGLLIDDRVLFSGDTRYDRAMFDWLFAEYPVEYIFHDCQLYTGGVHASYEELKQLPPEVRKKTFLCHYGDNVDCFNAVRDGFAGFAKQGRYYIFD